jgi:hypothetical protein
MAWSLVPWWNFETGLKLSFGQLLKGWGFNNIQNLFTGRMATRPYGKTQIWNLTHP